MSEVCIFTIVSRNYLHYARTLMESVAEHAPAADRLVGLCDKPGDFDFSAENFEILEMLDLDIPQIEKFIFRYTILELNTAIKPFIISKLFQQGYKKVIYFDPDIRIYRNLDVMLEMLDESQMLLTPHLTGQLDDDKLPSELNILVSGTYNLGYIGLRNSPDMQRFASWWSEKLYTDCVVDLEKGLFVDQKWVDLAPGMYEGVNIVRDPSWNVAYWNLNHRQVILQGEDYLVDGQPLLFFHFSGFSGESSNLSKHQNRFTKKSAGEAVEKLCASYSTFLEANGRSETTKLPYLFGSFADGTPIPDFARYIYREDYDWENSVDNPYEEEGAANFQGYLNEAISIKGSTIPWITRLAHKLYQARPDLQQAFPDLSGAYGKRFADWYLQSAAEQAGFAPAFIGPVRSALNTLGESDQHLPWYRRANHWFYRKLYRLAWRYRHLVRPLVKPELRHGLHVRLVERLASQTKEVGVARGPKDPSLPWGVNLYGYVNAESGIGQSARANIKSIQAAGIPISVRDFREGNESRMNESVDEALFAETKYNVNLFHINADETVNAIRHLGEETLRGRYNIGYWAWELQEFPDKWLAAIAQLDEIWVPSEFCRTAVQAKADIPVRCIPHAVMAPTGVTANRIEFSLPQDVPLVLTMYDSLSLPERKNPTGAISAFIAATSDGDNPAHLVVKVSNLEKTPEHASQLRELAESHTHVTLIEGYLERDEIERLVGCCDVFLSLHRAEGFGLGLAEAMSLGKLAIATGWSGNLQFMNESNSLLVDYSLTELDQDYGPYKRGSSWAEVDPDAAESTLKRALADSSLRDTLGSQAAECIRDELSYEQVGELIKIRLHEISGITAELADAG